MQNLSGCDFFSDKNVGQSACAPNHKFFIRKKSHPLRFCISQHPSSEILQPFSGKKLSTCRPVSRGKMTILDNKSVLCSLRIKKSIFLRIPKNAHYVCFSGFWKIPKNTHLPPRLGKSRKTHIMCVFRDFKKNPEKRTFTPQTR